jgi:hypothetical protein
MICCTRSNSAACTKGPELNNAVAEALRHWLGHTASATAVNADEVLLQRRKELTQKFVSGEWGVELAGYEAGREADRGKAAERAQAWRD